MLTSSSPLERLQHPLFDKFKLAVYIKRDDLLHNIVSGNKWRKLKYNLAQLKKNNHQGAITFGGSYSNHIHAFAYACKLENIPCIGVIRGEAQYANNFTLTWARQWGMSCHFVDRKTYRRRFETAFIDELHKQYPNHAIIPEGGSNALAIPGVSEVITELNQQIDFDTLLTPVGSGGTLAGLISGDSVAHDKQHKLLGIAVLKQAEYLANDIKALLTESGHKHKNWQLLTQFHRGGYGKFSQQDIQRILDFNRQTGIIFEPVYSGKMLLAFLDLIQQNYFKVGERIVLLHTGGLQGLGGMIEQGRLSPSDWPSISKAVAI
jgi:1-aminocyclopropane-1-carboxylate deaminase